MHRDPDHVAYFVLTLALPFLPFLPVFSVLILRPFIDVITHHIPASPMKRQILPSYHHAMPPSHLLFNTYSDYVFTHENSTNDV